MRTRPGRPARIGLLCAAGALCAIARPSAAQVIAFSAGSSTLTEAHGATIDVRTPTREITVGAGVVRGVPALRFRVSFTRRDTTITIGDATVDWRLADPLPAGARGATVRGVSVARRSGATSFAVTAGVDAPLLGAPYFQAVTPGSPVFGLAIDRPVSPRLSLFSRTIVQARTTSLNGVTWTDTLGLSAAAAGGAADSHPYSTAGVRVDRGPLLAMAQYGSGAAVLSHLPTMADALTRHGATVSARLRRGVSSVEIGQDHASLLDETSGVARTFVTQRIAATSALGVVRLAASAYRSRQAWGRSVAALFTAGANLKRGMEAEAEWAAPFSSSPSNQGGRMRTLRLRESWGARVSTQQAATWSDGSWQLAFGGRLVTNLLRLDVSEQTYVTPAAATPFARVTTVDVQVNLIAGLQMTGTTHVLPDGRARYTLGISHIGTRGADPALMPPSRPRMGEWIVRGRVETDTGAPVEGAILRVGNTLVASDASGAFFVRTSRRARLPLEVLVDDFRGPLAYRVDQSPPTVTPMPDGRDEPVLVLVSKQWPAATP